MSQITIPDENGWVRYQVDGAQSSFVFDFVVWAKSDLVVRHNGVLIAQDDYTFTGNEVSDGGFDGGTIVLNTAVSTGTLEIFRLDAGERTAQFPAGPIGVDQFNAEFNRIQAQIRDLQRDTKRALKINAGDEGNLFGAAATRALNFIKFDANGNPIFDDAKGPQGDVGPAGPQGDPGPASTVPGPIGPQGETGVYAGLNVIGQSTTTDDLPVSASDGDAFLIHDGAAGEATAHIWFTDQWYETFTFTTAASEAAVDRVIYVTNNGNDSNDGRALNRPKATISAAVTALSDLTAPAAVYVYPGVYEEDGEIEIPENCGVISAAGQYVTEIHASTGNEEKNMFLLNSGTYLQGFTTRNQRVDDFDNPSGGFIAAFASGATITRSPYIRDVGQVSQANYNSVAAPLDPANGNPLVGKGGGVILADRSVLNDNTIYPSILAFGATPRSPNGLGYVAKNGAFINGISSITIFQRTAFYALNGGQITLNNSGTQFGDQSMRSKGHMDVVQADSAPVNVLITSTAAADAIDAVGGTTGAIVNQLWVNLEAEYGSKSASYETFTRRDAANLLSSISNDLRNGSDASCRAFAKGMFDYQAEPVFDVALKAEFLWAFAELGTLIETYVTASAPRVMIDALITLVNDTVDNPTIVKFPSLIESLGHQFNNAGSGVNANALPVNFRRPGQNLPVEFSIVKEANGVGEPRGRVVFSGADEKGNQYFAQGTRINGLSGRIEGPAFESSVRQTARRAANARGAF